MSDKVRIEDYKKEVHELKVLLFMVGIIVEYPIVDLMYQAMEACKKKGGDFDIKDAVEMQLRHEQYWENYFEGLNTQEQIKD